MALRVRQILDADLTPFKKLLPRGLLSSPPEAETAPYPNALLTVLRTRTGPACYSNLGILAEELLRIPPGFVSAGSVCSVLRKWVPATLPEDEAKIRASPTTAAFCAHLNETARLLKAAKAPDAGAPRYEPTLQVGSVQGHPDILFREQVFEVKLTGQLVKNWPYFLCQVFSYAALEPTVKEVGLVLPLQKTVWRHPLEGWKHRESWRGLLQSRAEQMLAPVPLPLTPLPAGVGTDLSGVRVMLFGGGLGGLGGLEAALHGLLAGGAMPAHPHEEGIRIREQYKIGWHIKKLPKLADTVASVPHPDRPFQLFLGSTQSSKLEIKEADIVASKAAMGERRLFVHSPYIINLCAEGGEDGAWHVELLKKNLRYASAAGMKGVVVHVGKSTDKPLPAAMAKMRENILAALEAATPACPLLLETPAGQGTETLTDADEFIKFVQSFADPRLRICLDTCHTFACGQDPLTYIKKVQAADPALLTLIHFNDSETPCGSRKDRHAFIGTGKIGAEKMEAIAHHCHGCGTPMLVE